MKILEPTSSSVVGFEIWLGENVNRRYYTPVTQLECNECSSLFRLNGGFEESIFYPPDINKKLDIFLAVRNIDRIKYGCPLSTSFIFCLSGSDRITEVHEIPEFAKLTKADAAKIWQDAYEQILKDIEIKRNAGRIKHNIATLFSWFAPFP